MNPCALNFPITAPHARALVETRAVPFWKLERIPSVPPPSLGEAQSGTSSGFPVVALELGTVVKNPRLVRSGAGTREQTLPPSGASWPGPRLFGSPRSLERLAPQKPARSTILGRWKIPRSPESSLGGRPGSLCSVLTTIARFLKPPQNWTLKPQPPGVPRRGPCRG